ncbi:DUF4271 domain-containing protein [Psychroflexus sp. ALD_RP9]|uniref:DUF4271 domain-containing protein n=1 Tax=Psychroflexus sp. ALD_RP9 TaxID=2777186 RepID=UPI001A8FDF08|nr:DUF4271 domain-containing protein [Psychroflexus sp. ALD_RP9]QSS96178.1 DUF4271 domain-containing protein [Psychroflexus sp. ALD_RP9]
MEVILRNIATNNWLFLSLLGIGFCMAIAKHLNEATFYLFFKSDLLKSYLAEKERLKFSFNTTEVFLVTSTLLIIYSIIQIYQPRLNINFSPLELTFVGTFVLILKLGFEITIGYLSDSVKLVKLYALTKVSAFIFSTLICYPFFIIYHLNNNLNQKFIYAIFTLFVLINLAIIGFQAYKERNKLLPHWFYFILYICSLEIAPIIIALNWYKF